MMGTNSPEQSLISLMEASERIQERVGGQAYGDIFSGTALADVVLRPNGPNMNPAGTQIYYALVALHEFIHLAGGADQYGAPFYSDYVLAEAARIYTGAPGYPSGPPPRTREEQEKLREDVGTYWDKQLWANCMPNKERK